MAGGSVRLEVLGKQRETLYADFLQTASGVGVVTVITTFSLLAQLVSGSIPGLDVTKYAFTFYV